MIDSMTEPIAFPLGPQRIVCMTEETTEWLYLLGQEHRIVGISGYTVRPRRARDEKPRVSAFTSAKIDRILELQPDCVFGFSDMQADIAAALIRQGVQVTVFNQRSIGEIFSMMYQVAAMVGQSTLGLEEIGIMQQHLAGIAEAAIGLTRRPKIYFEEWDEPHISAIRWVSELMCWRRHRFDPGCRFPLTHPIGRDTRSVQRFQPLYPGAVKVGSLGQMVVGTHRRVDSPDSMIGNKPDRQGSNLFGPNQ